MRHFFGQLLLFFSLLMTCNSAIFAANTNLPSENTQNIKFKNTFDCNDKLLDWMKDCNEMNQNISNSVNKYVNTKTKEGIELIFAPGTPKAVIKLQTLRTPQAAKELADYEAQLRIIDSQSSALMRAELKKRHLDIVPTEKDMSMVKYRDKIAYKDLSVYVFYETTCKYCHKQFPILASLKELHPKLNLNLLQIDKDKKAFSIITKSFNLKSRILTDTEYKRYKSQIKGTPTIFIQNSKTKQHLHVYGFKNILELEKILAVVSGVKV